MASSVLAMSSTPLQDLRDDFLTSRIKQRYESEKASGEPSDNTILEYAWCLVRSPNHSQMEEGLRLIQGLLKTHQNCRDFRKSCLYTLAVGQARLKDFRAAFKTVGQLRQMDPNDAAIQALEKEIDKHVDMDALAGTLTLGTGVASIAGIAAVAISLLRR